MSAIKTIRLWGRLAAVIVSTTGWALGVVIRNAVVRLKEGRRGEPAKEAWVLSCESTYGVIVGFIGTQWDGAPTVGIATTYFEMRAGEIEAIAQKMADAGMSDQVMGSMIADALRANLQVEDLAQFSYYVAAFLGSSQLFAKGIAAGKDGFLVNLKLKGNKFLLRLSHRGGAYDVLLVINRLDNIRGDYGHENIPEELMGALDFRPEDESLIGKVEVHGGIVTQGGQPIALTKTGWLGTSVLAASPGMFPSPRVPRVSRCPASVLD